VELAQPHDYDPKHKEWKLESLPILPENMRLKVIRSSSFQFNNIRYLLKRPDVGDLIVATDAGREGELVARWIMQLSGWKKGCKRLWISSQTDAAIRSGFANLKSGNDYFLLFQAAVCRSEADWMIGINISRALTCKYDFSLSAGRVQTPTLSLMIEREKEINHFQPRSFWTLQVDFPGFSAFWQGKGGSRLFNQSEAEAIEDKITGQSGAVVNVMISKNEEPPPRAYDLAELQRDGNRFFSFSAKKTLQVLQGLYERHKLVTYPRTDSRYITRDMVPTLAQRIKALSNGPYNTQAASLLNRSFNPGKHFVNDAKVSDHHAIIPTELPADISRLSTEEKRIYDLVARRFMALLYPACKIEERQIKVVVSGETLRSKDRKVTDPGWRTLMIKRGEGDKSAEDTLPTKIAAMPPKGEKVMVQSV